MSKTTPSPLERSLRCLRRLRCFEHGSPCHVGAISPWYTTRNYASRVYRAAKQTPQKPQKPQKPQTHPPRAAISGGPHFSLAAFTRQRFPYRRAGGAPPLTGMPRSRQHPARHADTRSKARKFGDDRDRSFARIEQAELLWLLSGDRLVALTEHTATIETRTGTRQIYRCKPTDPGRVLARELMS
jgi:hypothetical protein